MLQAVALLSLRHLVTEPCYTFVKYDAAVAHVYMHRGLVLGV